MAMVSLRPLLMSKASLSPLRSKRALVATVVPILMDLIWLEGILEVRGRERPVCCSRILLMPSVGASL